MLSPLYAVNQFLILAAWQSRVKGLLDDVPLEQIRSLINGFMEELETRYSDVLAEVQKTGDLGGVAIETVRAALAEYKSRAAAAQ